MSKATLKDLNLILFEELERLTDDDELQGDNLDREIRRSIAITKVSEKIIRNANTILDAKRFADYMGKDDDEELLMLGYGKDEKMD